MYLSLFMVFAEGIVTHTLKWEVERNRHRFFYGHEKHLELCSL